jgi:hypothetical protein
MEDLLDTYNGVKECHYKNEHYSVRDNGAVFRHTPNNKRTRPTDNKWMFGKLNQRTGYLEIASVRVHRIVATAFHGVPPTTEHVVDHIDTNRQNNRPENLRWLTRFENAIQNPITAKRIALVCGSVEEFLADPSKFRDRFPEPNFKWMCTVNAQESRTSLKRMLEWAKSDQVPSGGTLDDWIFERETWRVKQVESIPEIPEEIKAKTPNAFQRKWRTPSEFPCCPKEDTEDPIATYAANLIVGSVFCRNDIYSSVVLQSAISDDHQLFVISESTEGKNVVKPWALAKITYENGVFVHTSLGNYFAKEGAEKQFHLAQGLEWYGSDSIDDYS